MKFFTIALVTNEGQEHGWTIEALNLFEAMKKLYQDQLYAAHADEWIKMELHQETKEERKERKLHEKLLMGNNSFTKC